MKPYLTFLLLSALFLAPLSSVTAANGHNRDSAVLTGLLQHLTCEVPTHGKQIVSDHTMSYDNESVAEAVDASAVQSLKARNKVSRELPSVYACKLVEVVSAKKIKAAFSAGGWSNFQKVFPGGSDILRLTLPGFSKDGKIAIVQGQTSCEGLCGHGVYWVLKDVNGKWVVVQRRATWVS